jgi:hypothetical protein
MPLVTGCNGIVHIMAWTLASSQGKQHQHTRTHSMISAAVTVQDVTGLMESTTS